jgi:dolichol-phosphate mannosyltransferase
LPNSPILDSVKVLVFTATYNERENIAPLIGEICRIVPMADILVLDDNSPDGTGVFLDEIADINPLVKVIHRKAKLGLGTAHSLAMIYAIKHGYDFLVTMDADHSHSPADIPRLISRLCTEDDGNADFVIGSRYMPGGSCDYGGYRKFLSVGGNWLTRAVTGIPMHEFTTSFRAFRVDKLAQSNFGWVENGGYSFFLEVAIRLHRAGLEVAEVPIHFYDRNAGASKIPKLEIFRGIKKLLILAIEWPSNIQDEVVRKAYDGICPKCSGEYLYEALPKSLHTAVSSPSSQNCTVKCLKCNHSFFL